MPMETVQSSAQVFLESQTNVELLTEIANFFGQNGKRVPNRQQRDHLSFHTLFIDKCRTSCRKVKFFWLKVKKSQEQRLEGNYSSDKSKQSQEQIVEGKKFVPNPKSVSNKQQEENLFQKGLPQIENEFQIDSRGRIIETDFSIKIIQPTVLRSPKFYSKSVQNSGS